MGKEMNVSRIMRTEKEEYAIKLRELARRVDAGEVAYAAVYVMDNNAKVEEVIFDRDDQAIVRFA
jgi:hypothetical protein